MTKLKTLTIAAAAALVAGGAFVASAPSADARMRGIGGFRGGWHGGGGLHGGWHGGGGWRGGGWGRRGGGWGGAAAAGLIGGLALGAIASAPAYAAPYYYDGYDYDPAGAIPAYTWRNRYAPVYYDGYAAPVRCWWQRQRVRVDPWTYQIRRVRVCR